MRGMIRKPGRAVAVLLVVLAVAAPGENLLNNPGFEEKGHWTAYLFAHVRNQWRSHDGGRYNAAILGLWADKGVPRVINRRLWADQAPNGMIEQRHISVEPGKRYVFKAWLWADLGWQPTEQFMKIIFSDLEGFILGEAYCEIPPIHPMWTPVQCVATAPEGSVCASVAIGARGVTLYGALTIDDVYFGEE